MRQNRIRAARVLLILCAAWLCGSAATVRAAMNAPASVTLVPFRDPWPSAQERWWDIANYQFNAWLTTTTPQQPNGKFSYSVNPKVTLTYDSAPSASYFVGHIQATGLKPNFAYQLKLLGKPVKGSRGWGAYGDDVANERIGYAGRWWCDSSHATQTNFDDSHYLNYYKNAPANGNPVHDIYGYHFMGDFVTDRFGNANADFTGQYSYHITWASWQGGIQDVFAGTWSVQGGMIQSNPTLYYGYGSSAPSTSVTLYYELESGRPQPVTLAARTYHCRLLLTEETFHNKFGGGTSDDLGGFWKGVLATEDLTSTGQPDTSAANDVTFTIGAPRLSINDMSVNEGNGGTKSAVFTVKLNAASGATIKINYATAPGATNPATAGTDYQTTSGTLTFAPGEISKTITVLVNGDGANEANETFVVNLSTPRNVIVVDKQGLGTIVNDDFPPVDVSLSPASATDTPGTLRTFTATYSDANGFADITNAFILINSSLNGHYALYGYYSRLNNKLYLLNDDGTSWQGGFAPGSRNADNTERIISNSQGSLNCTATTVSGSGNTLTVHWSFTPTGKWAGTTRKIYLRVRDQGGLHDGWDQFGTWSIASGVTRTVLNRLSEPKTAASGALQPFTRPQAQSRSRITYVRLSFDPPESAFPAALLSHADGAGSAASRAATGSMAAAALAAPRPAA